MEVAIINCFDTYEDRVDLVVDFFNSYNHNVSVITSDFRHFKKKLRKKNKDKFYFVKTKPYYKNLSIKRLTSHYNFSRNAIKRLEKITPDIIYVMIPPNSLTKFAAQYKMENKNVKLIFDIIDLWPETMPIKKIKNTLPLKYWKRMRDSHLKHANLIITECDLYQSILKDSINELPTKTVYLAKKKISVETNNQKSINEIHLCYIGSINNIIDVQRISLVVDEVNKYKPTTVHIIGDGESKENLIAELQKTGANIKFYGKVYDFQKKQNIIDNCHFGINIMKPSVCVGLTMKSIDYFQHGLPIINNIPSDTEKIVEKCQVGYNLNDYNVKQLAKEIANLTINDFQILNQNAYNVFNGYFSQEKFNNDLSSIFKEVGIIAKEDD